MKTNYFFQKTGLIAAIVVATTLVQVQAADMASASGTLADIAVMAVQAKASLASAANDGDVGAIAEATKRADAVDAAMADAQEAFSAKENAQDQASADAADEALDAAHQKADDALNGAVPEAAPKSAKHVWKESKTNTGGGPQDAYNAPNIYNVPWQSATMQSTYSAMFNNVFGSSGGSSVNSTSFGDNDATPI